METETTPRNEDSRTAAWSEASYWACVAVTLPYVLYLHDAHHHVLHDALAHPYAVRFHDDHHDVKSLADAVPNVHDVPHVRVLPLLVPLLLVLLLLVPAFVVVVAAGGGGVGTLGGGFFPLLHVDFQASVEKVIVRKFFSHIRLEFNFSFCGGIIIMLMN